MNTTFGPYIHIDVSKNSGVFPPNYPWINRVFQYKSSILGETSLFLETPTYTEYIE